MRSRLPLSKSVLLCLSVLTLTSCGLRQPGTPQPGRTDKEITRVIWIAGSVSIEAAAAYRDGTIPAKPEYKAAINGLGLSYEEAKAGYAIYLDAKADYEIAVALAAGCVPGDQACIDVAGAELDRRQARMRAAFVAVERIIAELPAHIDHVRRILGRG